MTSQALPWLPMGQAAGASVLRWSALSRPQRYEAYNRWSLYTLFGFVPLLGLAILANGQGPWSAEQAGAYLAVLSGHTLICFLAARGAFNHMVGYRAAPRALLYLLGGSVLAGLAVIVLVYPAMLTTEFHDEALFAILLITVSALVAVSPIMNVWMVLLAGLVIAALAGALTALNGAVTGIVPAVVTSLCLALALGITMRISMWTVMVVWDLDRSRQVAARLAVAEERLRFSRDLHDVFGRTLSTVAVKSELAAALAERDDPRGVQEMLAVRELAEDGLKEVRAVVQGYRAADLPTELVGARSLLLASGIEARVAGEDLQLPSGAQHALAWVVREGVTNVVRHSSATECTIELRAREGGYHVRIANDGVADSGVRAPLRVGPAAGSGLRGLAERLSAVGGTVRTPPTEPGWFVLSAWVPAGVTASTDLPADVPASADEATPTGVRTYADVPGSAEASAEQYSESR